MKKLFNVKCVMFNVLLLYTLHFTHYTAFAQPISSTDLINNAKDYDGKTVVYEGEVIGDIMKRGEFAWVNVHDGNTAIGIWAPRSLLQAINNAGSYKTKGDWVAVKGIFNRACSLHTGELDIHAEVIDIINPGKSIKEKMVPGKRNLVIMLLGVTFIVWILTLLKRR